MAERRAGELPGGYFSLQAGLHVREIVGVANDAAVSLSAFLDDVLPQAAHQGPRRVIEGCAKVGEGGSRRCDRRRVGCRCCDDRRRGICWRGGARIGGRVLINMINMMVTSVVSDASHSRPPLFRQGL